MSASLLRHRRRPIRLTPRYGPKDGCTPLNPTSSRQRSQRRLGWLSTCSTTDSLRYPVQRTSARGSRVSFTCRDTGRTNVNTQRRMTWEEQPRLPMLHSSEPYQSERKIEGEKHELNYGSSRC